MTRSKRILTRPFLGTCALLLSATPLQTPRPKSIMPRDRDRAVRSGSRPERFLCRV
jgi:hypothetical protein